MSVMPSPMTAEVTSLRLLSCRICMASDVIAPVPVTVRTPFLSIVQVTLLPSPSAPQVPLAGSTAKAAGTSASIRLSTSRMLRSFFFMPFLLYFLEWVLSV